MSARSILLRREAADEQQRDDQPEHATAGPRGGLHGSRLHAETVPRDASVVEVETAAPVRAHALLDRASGVQSIAQLGTRLHVLLDPNLEDPVERVLAPLRVMDDDVRARLVPASLEDVFVAATREAPAENAA